MPIQAKKLSFQDSIDTCLAFYNDEALEERFDAFVQERLDEIVKYQPQLPAAPVTADNVALFLKKEPTVLLRILGQLRLSEEKFKRIVTLLRKLKGEFDQEWTIKACHI